MRERAQGLGLDLLLVKATQSKAEQEHTKGEQEKAKQLWRAIQRCTVKTWGGIGSNGMALIAGIGKLGRVGGHGRGIEAIGLPGSFSFPVGASRARRRGCGVSEVKDGRTEERGRGTSGGGALSRSESAGWLSILVLLPLCFHGMARQGKAMKQSREQRAESR